MKTEIQLSDYIFCISRYLIEFLRNRGLLRVDYFCADTVTHHVFSNDGPPYNFPYIGYFGGLTFNRDSIDYLIRALLLFIRTIQTSTLFLVVFAQKVKSIIDQLISELKITSGNSS